MFNIQEGEKEEGNKGKRVAATSGPKPAWALQPRKAGIGSGPSVLCGLQKHRHPGRLSGVLQGDLVLWFLKTDLIVPARPRS